MTNAPVDTTTGLQCGDEVHQDRAPLLKGWLATHADGTEARLGPDKTRAEIYAATHHATLEALFVFR